MMSDHSRKIVFYLLRNFELVNINQLAKLLDISVGSAFKTLKALEEKNIVTHQKLGNAKFYSLNLNNDETKKICELLLLEQRRELTSYSKLYAQEIAKFENTQLIILFGSVLNNKNFNDVDVLFISVNVKEVNKFCLNLSKIKTKPIVPLILKDSDLICEIKHKTDAVISIIKTGIVLKGESKFVEIIQNAKS